MPKITTHIQPGELVTLPFHPDGNTDIGRYEIESLGPSPANGEPAARLISTTNGQRDRNNRGHYVRSTRTIEEIRKWNP